MKRNLFLLCGALLCSAAVWAQNAMPMPKPGPELKRLGYFVGNWSTTGTAQDVGLGPGGKYTSKDHNEWGLDGFFIVTHSESAMQGLGSFKEVAYFGYDAEKKVYTYHSFSSMGEEEFFTGTVNDKDWTWDRAENHDGKPVKGRFTVHEESPARYSMKYVMSEDGGNTWKTVMEGTATKQAGTMASAKPAMK